MTRTNPARNDARVAVAEICERVRAGQRFLITSHARPDGDSIGSQLAMAFALKALGKDVRVVNSDPAPLHYQAVPGVAAIELNSRVDDAQIDGLFVMECSDLSRPGIEGLDRFFVINVDHHSGNTAYGSINWCDESAAACGEMVFELVTALGVRLSLEIATHVYVAILTDTGSFHHSNITARTFQICHELVRAGVDPTRVAREVYDSNSFGKLRLMGALLTGMHRVADGRIAVLEYDDALLRATGSAQDDTEGLINLPLSAREVEVVVFFKVTGDQVRVSLRSKGDIDVREVARTWGGGGHRNASGFTISEPIADARRLVLDRLTSAIGP